MHKEAEGFGRYKAQEALGKNEHGQDSSTEDAEEKQRAIEAISKREKTPEQSGGWRRS